MLWNVFFVFSFSVRLVNSIEGHYQPPTRFPMYGPYVWDYFTTPTFQKPHQTAMEAMVDLTNNLGVAILQDRSFSRSNFAFSPYGVASVLVVLYEGARGSSAEQIQRAVHFPQDKDVIRIGFRDIHRHLRNYFSHEGYLSGISLNKDTSSLKPEYKKILRFYGYDVDLNQSSDGEDELSSENPTSETSSPAGGQETQPTASSQSSVDFSEITTPAFEGDKNVTNLHEPEKERTTLGVVDTSVTELSTQPAENNTETVNDTTVLSTTSHLSKTTSDDFLQEPTQPPGEDKQNEVSNLDTVKTTTVLDEQTPVTTESLSTEEFQIDLTLESCEDRKQKTEECTKEHTTGATEQNEVLKTQIRDQEGSLNSTTTMKEPLLEDSTTEAETEKEEKIEEISNASLDNGMLIPQPDDQTTKRLTEPNLSFKETTSSTGMPLTTEARFLTTETSEETSETKIKKKELSSSNGMRMEVKNDIKVSSANEGNKTSLKSIRSLINTKMTLWLSKPEKKINARKIRTITDYLKSPYNPDLSLQLQNGMYDTHVSRNTNSYGSLPRLLFLVDGAVDTPVPMMVYTNIFNYAYIPRLHSKALEFPLDDIRYKLLILLPVERRGLRELIYDLANFPLCNVLELVRPARVKVMVPTFMLEGFVILTSSLQKFDHRGSLYSLISALYGEDITNKLGVWDVFDSRKANLSGMTMDPDLYVRNVEQSVTVVIRNYVEILDIQTRTMAARVLEKEFEATHPFLYFVLDSETNVALMAGQILDPLSSKIY